MVSIRVAQSRSYLIQMIDTSKPLQHGMPPAGIEPARLAPEASALSAELQGLTFEIYQVITVENKVQKQFDPLAKKCPIKYNFLDTSTVITQIRAFNSYIFSVKGLTMY
jgi:hypothetical protein